MNKTQTKQIQAFNFYDFLVDFRTAVLEGFELSTLNENMPITYNGHFLAVLVREEIEVVESLAGTPAPEIAQVEPTLTEKLAEKFPDQVGAAPVPDTPKTKGRPAKAKK